ncbi:type II secretion system protein N [Vibrio lamellibrachiae]|uniref:type II secretion system protein N n=1 Tax=Vibrio lamellibrachiae TaxID=2910253 RepID=UPI003D0A265A
MKRIIVIALLIVLTLTVSLVAHMPARFALQYIPMPRALVIQSVQGTVWQGSVQQVSWQGTSLGQVHWNINPSQLLLGKAQAEVRFGQGSVMELRGRGVIGYSFSGAYAKETIASLPAQFAVEQLNLPLPLDLEGQLEVSLTELAITELDKPMPYCQKGLGSMVWSGNKAFTPIAELDLGPVVVNITCQDNVISLNGDQGSEQVTAEFEAKLEVSANGQHQYQASGWFKPEAAFPANLSSQLKWLGNPNNQGRYPLDFKGTL